MCQICKVNLFKIWLDDVYDNNYGSGLKVWYLKEISVTFEERFVNIFHSKWNGIFELMKFQVSEKRSCLNPDVYRLYNLQIRKNGQQSKYLTLPLDVESCFTLVRCTSSVESTHCNQEMQQEANKIRDLNCNLFQNLKI